MLYSASVHYLNCFGVWKDLPSAENLSLDALTLRASLFADLNESLRDPEKAMGDNVLTALAYLTYAEVGIVSGDPRSEPSSSTTAFDSFSPCSARSSEIFET